MAEPATKGDLAELRAEVHTHLSGVRSDLKDLAQAMRDLVRVESVVDRIGVQVDDHEKRLRDVEAIAPAGSRAERRMNRVMEAIFLSGGGAIIGYLLQHWVH